MTAQPVETSMAVYRALLRLYPAEHRAEYGPHMLQVFQDCCRDAYRRRQEAGVRDLWLSTALDLLKTAFEERTRRGMRMTREGFMRLSFLAALLGGALWTVGVLIMASRPPGPARGEDLTVLQLTCMLLFILACLGHALWRTRDESRTLAAMAVALTVVGTLVTISTIVIWGGDLPEHA